MTQTLVFLAGAVLVLMLLGHAFTAPEEKLPLRAWTPVYLADRVGHGLRALWAISRAQASRMDEMHEETALREERRRRLEERRRGEEPDEES